MPSQNPVHINVEKIMLESQVEGEEPTAYRGLLGSGHCMATAQMA